MSIEPPEKVFRIVCPVCGAWKQKGHTGFMLSFFEGLKPGSPEHRVAADSVNSMKPFMQKHLMCCKMAKTGLQFIYESDPGFDDLSPELAE